MLQIMPAPRHILRSNARVYGAAFSPDIKTLASVGHERIIRLWDVESGKEKTSLHGHSGLTGVLGIDFSPDGRILASSGSDKTVRIWNIANNEELVVLRKHSGVVFNTKFSPSGRYLASCGGDGNIHIYETATWQHYLTLKGHGKGATDLVFNPDDRLIASASGDRTLTIWELPSLKSHVLAKTGSFLGLITMMTSVALNPKGNLLACNIKGNKVNVWSMATRAVEFVLQHKSDVNGLTFSPDGRFLTTGCMNKSICIWDINSGNEIASLNGHDGAVGKVIFSPDGKLLASTSLDRTIRIWMLQET